MRRRKEQHHPLDHAAKEIIRLVPDLIPRLFRYPIGERTLRFADSSVRSREHRADQVLLVGAEAEPDASPGIWSFKPATTVANSVGGS